MEMLSGDTEVNPEPGENKEEAAAEDGEENNQAGLCEQDTGEPVELSQGSPRSESEEPLSTGEKHEDDETATDLCPDEETTCMEDSAKCTFCNAPEKPIPTLVDLKKQPHKNLFCCRRYKEEFETVIEELMKEDEVEKELMKEEEVEKELMNEVEKELTNEDQVEEELDIAPYADFSQAELRSNIKEKLLQHLNEGGFENHREILRLYLKFVTGMYLHCYPSGNVAILIMFSEEALFTYYILEDSKYPRIRAVFGSHGHGVCSYPDGHL
ncbi:Erich6b [Columba livia]|nr:Erich6b [Columba livia]